MQTMDNVLSYLCMDNVGGGDLYSLIQRHGPFAPEATKAYVAEIVLALAHLHSFDVVHRDVKPENVLVDLDGHLKLADLGSAKRMVGRIGAAPPPLAEATLVGTPEYMAPEVLLAKYACEDVDVWSIGAIACEISVGESPFVATDGTVDTLVHNIVHRGPHLPTHVHIGPCEASFLTELLKHEPELRLGSRARGGAIAILDHEWFGGMSARTLLTKQVAVPWVPHLNGPAPSVTPPTDALIAMTDSALATPLPPPAGSFAPVSSFDEFGTPTIADFGGDVEPPPLPEFPTEPTVPTSAAVAEAEADDDAATWSDSDDGAFQPADDLQKVSDGATAATAAAPAKPKSPLKFEVDESPESALDVHQLERRQEGGVAAGWERGSSSSSSVGLPSSSPPLHNFRRADLRPPAVLADTKSLARRRP